MTASLRDVLAAVVREMAFQRVVYPQRAPRPLSSHVAVCEQELFECRELAVKGGGLRPQALREMLQVAAVAVSALVENGLFERLHVPEIVSRSRPPIDLTEAATRFGESAAEVISRGLDGSAAVGAVIDLDRALDVLGKTPTAESEAERERALAQEAADADSLPASTRAVRERLFTLVNKRRGTWADEDWSEVVDLIRRLDVGLGKSPAGPAPQPGSVQ